MERRGLKTPQEARGFGSIIADIEEIVCAEFSCFLCTRKRSHRWHDLVVAARQGYAYAAFPPHHGNGNESCWCTPRSDLVNS